MALSRVSSPYLAQAGKTNAKGIPNLIRYAVIDHKYSDVLYPTNPPRILQKIVFAALYPLGRLFGYKADYPYPD